MSLLLIMASAVLIVILAMVMLILWGNWLDRRDYRPTISDVIQHLEDCRSGQMDRWQYDEFSSCRITYDPRLDAIRERFNDITDDSRNIDGAFSQTDATALNDRGKDKISELIRELRDMPARPD